ncbi:unnamed protein product, partial [Prorocentrum cordatum]
MSAPAYRNGSGGNGGQSSATWRWPCCGCNRNKLSWFWCKHCGAQRQKPAEPQSRGGAWAYPGDGLRLVGKGPGQPPLRPGLLTPGASPLGATAAPTIPPDAKLEDIQATIDTLTKVGDRVGAAHDSKTLEQRKGKLEKAVAHFQRLESQLAEQKEWVSKFNEELAAAESEHTQLVRALHANTCGPPSPTSPAPANVVTISIDDILEGKSDLPISMGSFGQLDGGIYELDQRTRDEAKQRMEKLQADIKAALGVLFGDASAKIK